LNSGTLLHLKITEVSDKCVGIDIDQESILWLAEHGVDNIELRDVHDLDQCAFEADVIVFGETIEHLANPGECLASLHRFMGDSAELIISTPNCLGLWLVTQSLRNFEKIHDDHLIGFTPGLLAQILQRHGFEIAQFYFTFLPGSRSYWWQWLWRHLAKIRPGVAETLCVVSYKSARKDGN
jgi:SAM-dependent methyltransferase